MYTESACDYTWLIYIRQYCSSSRDAIFGPLSITPTHRRIINPPTSVLPQSIFLHCHCI